MGRTIAAAAVTAALAFMVCGPVRADDRAQAMAIQAARAWLKLVDQGDYRTSWRTAAGLFRGAVSEAGWNRALNAVRKPLGRLLTRSLVSATHRTRLPGAPDGNYVVIQFQSSFEHKQRAVETITPMLEDDEVWRISGYYIR